MIGQQFSHFEVIGSLGSGGMGVVYLARDLRLDRRVAIKVLADGRVADEAARTRFRREAQALSRLNHPNIATIYDFDHHEGRDLLVMEYIEGKSLRDVGLDPLPPGEIVRLGTQLAEALVAAHGAGVVHLDLKPGNLMLTPDGRLKVLDFGIARLHSIEPPDGTTQTSPSPETGTLANSAGTPPYMAPEQVAAGPVDGRTDIYGAGATLYELATGRRLFTEPRGVALYESILRGRPDPPSRLNPAIDPLLEETLLKALAKYPSDRHQTAQELLADFQRCGAAPPWMQPRRWSRREVMLTAAASVVAIGVTGYALWPVNARARFKARDFVLVGDLADSTGDPTLSRTIKEALTIALQQSHFVNLVSRERIAETLRRMQRPVGATVDETAGLDICRREGIPALISGSIARSGQTTQITVKVLEARAGSLVFAESAEYTKPDQLFARIDDLARRLRENFGESASGILQYSQPLERVTTSSLDALQQYSAAVEARAMGRVDEVEAPLLAALRLDNAFAMAHLKLGDYYTSVAGDDMRARPHIDTAYTLRDRVTDRESHFIAAQYFIAHQRFEEARDSLRILTRLYPADPELHYELALAYYSLEQLPLGITALRQAIRYSPHAARPHGSLVLFLARDNQPDAALHAFEQARAAGVVSPYLYWASGLAYLGKGDIPRARADFEKLGQDGTYASLANLQMARVLLLEGQHEAAVLRLREFIETARRESNKSLEFVARHQLGRTLLRLERRADARLQAVAATDLVAAPDSRPAHMADAGSLAFACGEPARGEQLIVRLRQLEASAPARPLRAARLFLEGILALHERRWSDAAGLFSESATSQPWYECWQHLASVHERSEQWREAANAWTHVLAAKGQILQDGFPPDLALAENRLAFARARLARKD
jgi:tetratricopeptide (TPR) repeat protein/predicted Ser/Thr protein kinase